MNITVRVGDLGKVITGNTPPRSNPELYGNYIPFIKATDISENEKYTYTPEEYYSEEGFRKYKTSLIPKHSTCVVTIGSIGKKMTMACQDCFINQAMNAIIPNDDYDYEYVYYLLKNNIHKLKNLDSGTASGRENVSKSAFMGMELSVIKDKVIQKRIGSILSAYDDLIENNQKQIKLLEEAAQRLYKEWFVDLRFPGHESVKIVDGVSEGWSRKQIFELGKIITGKTPNTSKQEYYGGSIPFVKIPDMHNCIYTISTESTLTKLGADKQKNNYIPENSIMVSCIGTVGLVNISSELCQTNQQINSIVLKNREDVYYLFFSMKMLKTLLDGVGSNGATMINVNKSKFSSIEILYPNAILRNKYFSIAKPYFRKIYYLSKQISYLREARDRLLPKLMNGEIEV
ncbi:restriction endonuclease subunit S [uncultured Phascolarctobacterium sp.]|uniref:restriction endonuclease subunit S n=1 Tax=uncultured Phascolarctobacterium sp. TaxID=512296 RepID=UPI0025E09936|nr:restriction endonuclease subunit S [uncultured Phascolarctobacterium sp.]